MNRKRLLITALAILLLLVSAVPAFAAQQEKPEITAKGAVVYCQNTGEIIYEKNREQRIDPYSVTKLMTVLLAVQNLPLDKEVTVSEKAASQPGSTMDLQAGEVVTVEDLIYGAMLPSGNDAAYALGEAVSGDMESFTKLMNKTAANIGCENTHFTNPSGLQNKNHYTTAYDMMLITKAALSSDIVRKAAGAQVYRVEKTNKSEARTLKTHIEFLKDSDSGVYAGKTGYWADDDCSIALGYKKNGLHFYIVLLGDTTEQRSKDVEKLITYANSAIEGIRVVGKGEEMGKVRIKHGAKTRLETYTAETGYAYLPAEASESLISTRVVMRDDLEAPVKKGDVAGTLEIYAADELVNEVDLIVKENVKEGWFTSYLGISNTTAVMLGIAAGIFLLLCIWVSITRMRYKRRKKRWKQKRIMEIAKEEMRREEERRERDWRF